MENPSLERQMEFNGLAIYYSAYAEGGVSKTTTEKAQKQNTNKSPRRTTLVGAVTSAVSSKASVSKGSKELKELCKLMQPWKSIDETTEIGKDTV